jgi:hypothetical protein
MKRCVIKLSPQKLARIIAECACQEMGSISSSGGGDIKLPDATRYSAPNQDSVDAGLFPGMGDTPALSDSPSGANCADRSTSSPSQTDNAYEPPIDHVDDAETVELVIGSI